MKQLLHAFAMCQSMFCAIPCPWNIWDEKARDKLLWCLPGVGLEIGVLWWFVARICILLQIPSAAAGFLICAIPFFATGFLHMDGFMDVTDAVKSCRDLQRRREILKDSHVGSFAVIGCCLLLLAQFAFCCSFSRETDIRILIGIPVISRCGSCLAVSLLPKMSTSQYARQQIKTADWVIPLCWAAAALAFGFLVCGKYGLALLGGAAGYGIALRRAFRSLEGMNGDISGYSLTVSELAAVAVAALL